MGDGLRVCVRLHPGARRNGVEGIARLADGGWTLKARVTAPPEGGKANAALIALLAKLWRLPRGAIAIAAGGGTRNKVLHVAGDPRDLEARLTRWLRDLEQRERT